MQFFAPEKFIFLWTIPAIVVIFMMSQKLWKEKIQKIGSLNLISNRLIPSLKTSGAGWRTFYLILALILMTAALARPQWGEEKRKVQRKGVDIVFMLDTSLSMLAEDTKPNRLEKSKLEIRSILRQLKGDRVGMVAFAGSSFLQCPLTLDYSAFQLFVDAINTGYIPDPGTSFNQALLLAIKSFPKENLKHKVVILFSDGEDHEGGLEVALKELTASGIRMYSIGVGAEKGDPIPLKDDQGRKSGFKKNRQGEIVITKLNPAIMKKIADAGNGLYLPSTPSEQEIRIILKHMENLGQKQLQENTITEREDQFQGFLLLAFLFLCMSMLTSEYKKPSSDYRFRSLPVVIIMFFLFTGFIDTPRKLNNDANELFQNKKYQSAIEKYRKAQVKNPDDPLIRYNLGSALYQTQNYQEAAQSFEQAIKNAKDDKNLKASALYNYGNTQYRLGNFEKAIESYQKALELNPKDKDAKYNLEFLENKKSLFDKKSENQKQDQNKQQQNQPQQNQDQNQQQNQQNQQQQQQQQNQQNNQNQQQQQQQQQNNQNQQNQNQQQNQDQKDQQKKDQQQQQQDQQDQQKEQDQKQDQQEQKNQDQQQEQQQDQKQNESPENQQDQQKNEQEKQDQGEQQEDEQKNPQEPNQDEQNQQQPEEPSEEEQEQQQPDESQEQEEQGQSPQASNSGAKRPLQGQMSLDNALQILDALKDSEKELQDLRKPAPPARPRVIEKDW